MEGGATKRKRDFSWSSFHHEQGVPILNETDVEIVKSDFETKEDILESLTDYICSLGPQDVVVSAHHLSLTIEDVHNVFSRAVKYDCAQLFLDVNENAVVMKHDEYSFDCQKCLAIIQLGRQMNEISDFFHHENRLACGGYNRVSPVEMWRKKERKVVRGVVSTLLRLTKFKTINIGDYVAAGRLSSTVYTAAQFKTHAAYAVYTLLNGVNVIDFSMGWGDRLAGWFCANQGKTGFYYGCDPNQTLHRSYDVQIQYYTRWSLSETNLTVSHMCQAAEDVDWSFVQDRSIDLIFTSPPYGSTERYAKGTETEASQSWSRYPDNDVWFEKFMKTVICNTFPKLKNGGILAINIIDPDAKGKRDKIVDRIYDLCASLGMSYNGFIGMRMKQRPKKWHSDEEKKNFMSAISVEPIWVFEKQETVQE